MIHLSNKMKKRALSSDSGMTLIELMIGLTLASILTAVIFTIHQGQVQGQVTQEAALEMQQGLRAALTFMEREIRTAGADPLGTAGARILIANDNEFQFDRDLFGVVIDGMEQFDGFVDDENENIRYAIIDGNLGRETCRPAPDGCSGLQSLLDNVDALNFVYIDRAGDVIPTPVLGLALNDIRQVQVTIVARYGQSQRGMLTEHTDANVYRNQQPGDDGIIFGPANDTSRRLRMTTTITCRNVATGT